MKLFNTVGDFFALDIGTTAVRVVELSKTGRNWSLQRYGMSSVDMKIATSDSPDDQRKLAEVIMTVIGQSGIKSKNVVIGIPSNKMFATVVDMPNLSTQELASSIKYQAEQFIPMSLDEAKIDWALLGKSINDANKNEVLIASVANNFSEARLDMIEGLGLNVIAMEPDSLAVTRALLPEGINDARIIVEVGDFATDVIITCGEAPRLIRAIPIGMEAIIKSAAQNLNIQPDQARQFMTKFGVLPDKLEGQIFRAVENTLDQFSIEIVKSVKFFRTRYPSVEVSTMIVSNYGVTVPGLADYLNSKVGIRVELGNPWQKVHVSANDQVKLQPLSSQFAVAIGLAERNAT